MRFGEAADGDADVGVQVVPDQDDRGMELGVRRGEQSGVTGFGQGPALALAPGMEADPAGEPAAGTGPVAGRSV